jgi:hypothetical protein
MSVFALWLSKALWGWEGLVLVFGITLGIGLLVAGLVRFFSRGASLRR